MGVNGSVFHRFWVRDQTELQSLPPLVWHFHLFPLRQIIQLMPRLERLIFCHCLGDGEAVERGGPCTLSYRIARHPWTLMTQVTSLER